MQKVAENSEFIIVGDEMYLNCMILGLPSFEPLDELANVIGDLYFDDDDNEYCFHNALTDKFTFLKKLPVIQTLHSIESLFFPMTPPLTPQYNLVPQYHDIHSNYLGSLSDLNVLDTSFISSSTPLPPWPQLNAPTGLVTPASFCDAVKKKSPEVNPPSPRRVSQIAQTINLQTTASNTITASITASTPPVPSVDCNDCKTTIRKVDSKPVLIVCVKCCVICKGEANLKCHFHKGQRLSLKSTENKIKIPKTTVAVIQKNDYKSTLDDLVKYIENAGGTITANMLGAFYSENFHHRDTIKNEGNLKSFCEKSNGVVKFIPGEDGRIGSLAIRGEKSKRVTKSKAL